MSIHSESEEVLRGIVDAQDSAFEEFGIPIGSKEFAAAFESYRAMKADRPDLSKQEIFDLVIAEIQEADQ